MSLLSGGRYFRGPKTNINIDDLPDYRKGGESADVEEFEFFSDSRARKAKLSALSPWQKNAFYSQESFVWLAPVMVQY